jgi:Ca-activated chloride channel homolog
MLQPTPYLRYAAVALIVCAAFAAGTARAADDDRSPCTEDAMLVFDASGSMSGNGWGYGSENPTAVSRIDKVRLALGKILPRITRMRRVGLITYGPGPYQQCNVELDLRPAANAAGPILDAVNALTPAGQTPLSDAVAQAAEVLDYRAKPGVIVVLTDGEETCGGNPCELGKALHRDALQLTVHVIGLRVKGLSWTGEQSIVETRCLAEQTGGLYIAVETEEALIDALEKTLGCPMLTEAAGR